MRYTLDTNVVISAFCGKPEDSSVVKVFLQDKWKQTFITPQVAKELQDIRVKWSMVSLMVRDLMRTGASSEKEAVRKTTGTFPTLTKIFGNLFRAYARDRRFRGVSFQQFGRKLDVFLGYFFGRSAKILPARDFVSSNHACMKSYLKDLEGLVNGAKDQKIIAELMLLYNEQMQEDMLLITNNIKDFNSKDPLWRKSLSFLKVIPPGRDFNLA